MEQSSLLQNAERSTLRPPETYISMKQRGAYDKKKRIAGVGMIVILLCMVGGLTVLKNSRNQRPEKSVRLSSHLVERKVVKLSRASTPQAPVGQDKNYLAVTADAYLIYGNTYRIQNGYSAWGGWLDTRRNGCQQNNYCVSVCGKDRLESSKRTASWRIVSWTGKTGTVGSGDLVYLVNQYDPPKGFLDTRGSGCEHNLLCVSTTTSPNRHAYSGVWKIELVPTENHPSGTPIPMRWAVTLLNYYNGGQGGYLDTRGNGCSLNLLCVSTSTSSNRDSGSGHWRFDFELP